MKPVLLLYTADKCSGCKMFKPKWPGIKDATKDYVSEFVEFSQNSLNASDWDPNCPSALRSSVVRFPSLFLINGNDYKRKDSEMRFIAFAPPAKDIAVWVKETSVDPLLVSNTPPEKKLPGTAPPATPKPKVLPYSLSSSSATPSCSRAYKLHKSD